MKSPLFEDPLLFTTKADDVGLSGQAVLDLMREVLDRDVPFRFRARGMSMTPFIRDQDIVTVSPLTGTRAGLGRVVAFVHPTSGRLVVHRVVKTRGDIVILKGDALQSRPDEVVSCKDVLGEITRIERDGRAIRLGLGPERRLLARLSHAGLLVPLRACVAFAHRLVAPDRRQDRRAVEPTSDRSR